MDISKKTARRSEPISKTLHTAPLQTGLFLGYRKGIRGGTWTAKMHRSGFKYEFVPLGGMADDTLPADGKTVLSFDQAATLARAKWAEKEAVRKGDVLPGSYTVSKCVEAYLADLEARKGDTASLARTRLSVAKHITGSPLDNIQLQALRHSHLDAWFTALGAVRRSRKGSTKAQAIQRAHSTANRIWTILRSALNYGFKKGRVATKCWERISPFAGVEAPKVRYLKVDKIKLLREHMPSEFKPLYEAGIHTAARWGEICNLKVEDFNGDAVHIGPAKGKGRWQPLTAEGKLFFASACAGKQPEDWIFTHSVGRHKGEQWLHSQQSYYMKEACDLAGIKQIGFHCATRHSFASLLAEKNTPMHVIANLLGHANGDVRLVTKHYAHLSDSYVSDQLQANLPSFE
jgi:integrase